MANGNYHPVVRRPDPFDSDRIADFVVIDGEYFEVKDQIDPDTHCPCKGIFYKGVKPVVQRNAFGPGLDDVVVLDDEPELELPADFF